MNISHQGDDIFREPETFTVKEIRFWVQRLYLDCTGLIDALADARIPPYLGNPPMGKVIVPEPGIQR
jgi:hypothetical protein